MVPQHAVHCRRADPTMVAGGVVQAQRHEQVHVVTQKRRRLRLHKGEDGAREMRVADGRVVVVVAQP